MAIKKSKSEWIDLIEEWKSSGLSAQKWCKEKNIPDYQFSYWKKKLSSPFIELKEEVPKIAFRIQVGSLLIYIENSFSSTSLKQLLEVVKSI